MWSNRPVYFKYLLAVLAAAALAALAVFYFIPAFRGDISVQADFFVGPVRFHWYGIIMAAALLVGFVFSTSFAADKIGLDPRHVERALPYIVGAGFLGARLYFVAFNWDFFRLHPEQVLAIWRGGISIYGAILGGLAAIAVYARFQKTPFWKFLDAAALALPLAQGIGRLGNFFNAEAFGGPTSLPWRMYVEPAARPLEFLGVSYFHPTFLYEALWDFAVFAILLYLMRGTKSAPGMIAGSYLVLYSLGRFWIESLRLDSFFVGAIRADQGVALLGMVAGAFIIYLTSHDRKASD